MPHALLTWAPEYTITIQPGDIYGKDAYVKKSIPNSNYDWEDLVVGTSNNKSLRSYLQFDLSSLQEQDAVVVDASLRLYYYYNYPTGPTALEIGLYEVKGPWEEDTITWDNQPASSDVAEAVLNIPASPPYDFVYWYIYGLVEGWYDGSITNYGMLLRDTDESSADDFVWFCAYNYWDGINRPKLVTDYYIP